ncbi:MULTISPECIES: hypothetical protein [Bacillus]|uniref:hypothetical protein n=1 Tax=Bacillus TaxID=1386 RepID=UPI000B5D9578|nr:MULTISPECIES: hypothetical protein [Bacillus]OXC00147.1 hypothetical protein CGQ22_02185 [Bacillus sp. M13(2017)]QCY63544.1 hypothetical protein FHE73_23315 [Bacillus thuringiensis]
MKNSINLEAFLNSPVGRKLQNEAEKHISKLKEERDKKKETLKAKEFIYGELTTGASHLRNVQLYREIEGIPSVVETNSWGQVDKITPLKNYGDVPPTLAEDIKKANPLVYRRLRSNDLKDIPKSDAFYETEIYSENCPVEIFDAYIQRPSNDPGSPRYSRDWLDHYNSPKDFENGESKQLKQLTELYSTENLRVIAQDIRALQTEIENIEKEIY